MTGLRVLIMLFTVGFVGPIHAIQQFERNGSSKFRMDYQGSISQFFSSVHRGAFVAELFKYVPQFGGFCSYGNN
ncbi:MAG: hypothetical protein JSR31_07395 [Nitrospira sp.]|nr:hypothetical protein [Nitrospira sp.]